MEPRPEDISKLRAELLNSFNRDEMRILGEEFNFPFDLDIPEGPYRTQVFNMVQLLRSKGRLPELLECAKKAASPKRSGGHCLAPSGSHQSDVRAQADAAPESAAPEGARG